MVPGALLTPLPPPKKGGTALTNAGLLGGGALEALVALAVVGARRVDAVAVDAGAARALVHICKGGKTSPVRDPEAQQSPGAARAARRSPGSFGTAPLTDAFPPDVLLVAHVALAAVAGRGGDAAPVQAQVGEVFADVDGLVQSGRSWGAYRGLGSPWGKHWERL